MSFYNVDLVQINKFSRPATKLVGVRGIIIHWTANAGASDTAHKTFFDGADGGGGRYAGCHFFVDRDSATLIIPLDEVAYHANEVKCKIPSLKATTNYYKNGDANLTTIGIEMCVEKDGTIHPETVERTAKLTAHLCTYFKLETKDIYRHHDITGKNCPAPWVKEPVLFTNFKNEVHKIMNPVPVVTVNPNSQIPFKVTIPNTAYWQTVVLVKEYTSRGYKSYGQPANLFCSPEIPKDSDPLPFVIETNYAEAIILVKELQGKGYKLAYGERI
jgi:N-acetylmuramoyl-L-alanine amidase